MKPKPQIKNHVAWDGSNQTTNNKPSCIGREQLNHKQKKLQTINDSGFAFCIGYFNTAYVFISYNKWR